MQDELAADHPELEIHIIFVNADGYSGGIPTLDALTDLPVTQDDSVQDVWDTWGVTWRDVWILDSGNAEFLVYNLTTYDLSNSANYAALYDYFVDAATP